MSASRKHRWQSRLACLWSAEKLCPTLEQSQLFPSADNLPHEFRENVFFWTWTFSDPVPRSDAREAMFRWRKFARWLDDTGKQCLRALERGGKNGHYHFHAITHQRWDVDEIRLRSASAGFGRINVTVIPRERVTYLAKYMGKPGRFPVPPGVRLWACVGFKGVQTNDVRCRITELTRKSGDVCPVITSVKRWTLDGVLLRETILRPDWNGDLSEVHIMNITKETIQHIASLVAAGSILAVAEYRTCTARKLEFDEKVKGVPTGKRVVRKIVEHGVEIGAEQVTVSEWLPDDADVTAVKAPASKGEPVLIEVSQFSRQFGITAKSIRSLANFNGKLA